ncbi:MAG: GNAT family N-acetyltransferase [Candidatus Binatia bacterium]
MLVALRQGRPNDAEACGRICYEAFRHISGQHNFPQDFPDPDTAIGVLSMMLSHPGFYVVVAEQDGKIIGSNALDERSAIAGIGPITVDPSVQNAGTGRQLMQHVMDRVAERRFPGVRLVQAAYHNRSLSLYTKLGFDPREPLACMQGPPLTEKTPGYSVRAGTAANVAGCDEVCQRVHGHARSGEVTDALQQGTLHVVEHGGRITGYTTGVAFFAHSVGETNNEIKALIAAAPSFGGPGFLVPIRNADLFRWCLSHGLRMVQVMTLMSVGLYNEPHGAWLPSILY